jgi:hypothetical protein
LEAPASTPMKPMNKNKKGDANKGIKIAENATVPAMDDVSSFFFTASDVFADS